MLKIDKLGWIVAAGLGGIMIGGGFQGGTTKIGVVDFGKILDTNEHSKVSTAKLTKVRDSREDLLKFMADHRTATAEQLIRLKTLTIKDSPSAAEEAEIKKLRTEIENGQKKYDTLVTKQPLTVDEQAVLKEMGARVRSNETILKSTFDELDREINTKASEQGQAVTEKARQALEEVGKAGGYSVIFDMRTAPYGATDVTDSALKTLNAKK